MKTTVNALKGLFTKLGGNAEQVENVSTIPDMIDEITEAVDAGSGGSKITVNGETMMVK